MDYLLTCDCGRQIAVSRSQAGQEIRCECGAQLRVPTLRGLTELPPATSESNDRSPPPPTAVWGGWRGTVLAIAAAIFLIFAVPCAWFLFQRSQLDTSFTVESELAAGNAQFDTFGPAELTSQWYGFEKFGLGQKEKPGFYYVNLYAREREILATITGTIAALAGGIVLTLVLTARRRQRRSKP